MEYGGFNIGMKTKALCAPSGSNKAIEAPWRRGALHAQSVLDCATRTASGIPVFLPLWLIVTGLSGVWAKAPLFAWGNAVCLIVLAAGRYLLMCRIHGLIEQQALLAEKLVIGSLLLTGGYWGVLTGICLFAHDLVNMRWPMLLITSGVCTATAPFMGLHKTLFRYYALCLILPGVVAVSLRPSEEGRLLLILVLASSAYIYRSALLARRDYWEALKGRVDAEARSRELEILSVTDALTQVSNRLCFQRQLLHDFAHASRQKTKISVLMIDLDHFKQINDTYGHPFGDICLQQVAAALRSAVHRPEDLLARYGGEEFVVLLPGVDEAGAALIAERALHAIRNIEVECRGTKVTLTASIGGASVVPDRALTSNAFIDQADRALYRAKREGRNRACF